MGQHQLRVVNRGKTDATNAVLTLSLPPGIELVGATPSVSFTPAGVLTLPTFKASSVQRVSLTLFITAAFVRKDQITLPATLAYLGASDALPPKRLKIYKEGTFAPTASPTVSLTLLSHALTCEGR
jgi:hypothetical protein